MPTEEKLHIGCSGWSYKDWLGPFYPKNLEPGEYLKFYSSVFDCVEIDSSFYRIPSASLVEQWRKSTPDNFLFSPKLPKKITHENKLLNFQSNLAYFYSVMARLGDKLGPIVIQLPPSIKLEMNRASVEDFVGALNPKFRHAIEFRHKSWFTSKVYQLLEEHNVSMIWSLNQYLETPAEVTSRFVYLRMVGDRELTDFSETQKDRTEEMKRWASKLTENSSLYDDAFVFFNNHFAGFGPDSVNEFRRLMGLVEVEWAKLGVEKSGQQTLSGF